MGRFEPNLSGLIIGWFIADFLFVFGMDGQEWIPISWNLENILFLKLHGRMICYIVRIFHKWSVLCYFYVFGAGLFFNIAATVWFKNLNINCKGIKIELFIFKSSNENANINRFSHLHIATYRQDISLCPPLLLNKT